MATKLEIDRSAQAGLNLFYLGEVTELDNASDDSVIRVRISSLDKGSDNKGEWALPLQPVKYFHALPKSGDTVFVLFKEYTKGDDDIQRGIQRYWMGPIEPIWETVGETDFLGKYRNAPDSADGKKSKKNINLDESKKGVYPTKDEVAVHKGNTDIILSDTQINIRAGKFEFGDNTKSIFNNKNTGIINIKYGSSNIKGNEETEIKKIKKYVDPEYSIYAEVREIGNDVFGYIRLSKISDGAIVKETDASIDSSLVRDKKERNLVIKRMNDYIVDNIKNNRRYSKWVFVSSEPEFKKNKKYFDGYENEVAVTGIKKPKNITGSDGGGSVINIMSNRINLYSYDGLNKNKKLLNNDKQIDEEEQRNINANLQSVVYGEKLVEFLNLVKVYVTTHIHPFHGMPPIQDNSVLKITEFNLDGVLNKNIKTN